MRMFAGVCNFQLQVTHCGVCLDMKPRDMDVVFTVSIK